MPNIAELIDVLPHYLAMLTIVFVSLDLFRMFLGEVPILVDLMVVLLIVFSYRHLVVRLGFAPASWEMDD